jgi:hypothetical protein
MSTAIRDHLLSTLEFSHGLFMHFVDGFPAEHAFTMPSPTENHMVWQIGHLAVTHEFFCGCVSKQTWKSDEKLNGLFGMASKPVNNPSLYPSLAESQAMLASGLSKFVGLIKQYDDAALSVDAEIDTHGFLKTKLDTIGRNAFHYGWHLGQVSALRRSLHLPAKF